MGGIISLRAGSNASNSTAPEWSIGTTTTMNPRIQVYDDSATGFTEDADGGPISTNWPTDYASGGNLCFLIDARPTGDLQATAHHSDITSPGTVTNTAGIDLSGSAGSFLGGDTADGLEAEDQAFLGIMGVRYRRDNDIWFGTGGHGHANAGGSFGFGFRRLLVVNMGDSKPASTDDCIEELMVNQCIPGPRTLDFINGL